MRNVKRTIRVHTTEVIEELAPPQLIERAVLRGRHEPRSGIIGYSGLGPLLERTHERIVRELLRDPDLIQHACEARDDLGRFHSPHRLDRALNARRGH